MTDTDEEGINVVIDFNHTISMIRFCNNRLMPCHVVMRAEVLPDVTAKEIDFDVAFAKIKFWFETIVAHSVVLCRSNKAAMELLLHPDGRSRILNHMMLTPYEPTDEHLAVLFQSKMTALSNGTLQFGCVRIESDLSNGLVFTYVGDWEQDLPAMDAWFDKVPYYFNHPWWTRNDASVTDYITDDDDPAKLPAWAFKLDFIENALHPHGDDTDTPNDNVVIRGAFSPKIIDGGRKD